MKRCSPPAATSVSRPGRSQRWYVFASTMLRAELAQVARLEQLHVGERSDRHEARRLDVAVRGASASRAARVARRRVQR